MKDEGLAQLAREAARGKAEWVRDYFDTLECRELRERIEGSRHSAWLSLFTLCPLMARSRRSPYS